MTELFDWSKSSVADRILLHRAFRSTFEKSRTLRDAIEIALEKLVGDAYADNFRRGINARGDCSKLFGYLRMQDPHAADELLRSLQPATRSLWDNFYKQHRVDDRLAVAVHVEHTSPLFREPPGDRYPSFDEPFFLQLDSDIEGYALGFWRLPRYWFPLFVGPTPVTPGRQWITRNEVRDDAFTRVVFNGPAGTGEIAPTLFRGDTRRPDFVVVVASKAAIDRFAQSGGTSKFPIGERAIDTFPTVLEASKSPWFIAWVAPYFNARNPL